MPQWTGGPFNAPLGIEPADLRYSRSAVLIKRETGTGKTMASLLHRRGPARRVAVCRSELFRVESSFHRSE